MVGFTRQSCWLLVAIATLAALLSLASCSPVSPGWMDRHDAMHGGQDTSDSAPVSASGTAEVTIGDYAFTPGNLRVTAGTTVTWTNRDEVPHTATADGEAWTTGLLREGQSSSVTFDQPGVYEYFCQPHPDMRARIEVVP